LINNEAGKIGVSKIPVESSKFLYYSSSLPCVTSQSSKEAAAASKAKVSKPFQAYGNIRSFFNGSTVLVKNDMEAVRFAVS